MITYLENDDELRLVEDFIGRDEAWRLHHTLLDELEWRSEEIVIYGKPVAVPRLVCWYGDPSAIYTYSGVEHIPLPWSPTLKFLKEKVQDFTHHAFNSVLANLYRDGDDSMGWHADKEKELGKNPYIASLSFGEERLFKIRHNKTKQTFDLTLPNGSLLLMGGSIQSHWRHSVPKTKQKKQSRINLTFRCIVSAN